LLINGRAGHAGHETADFAVSALPIQISAAVANASKKDIPAILRRTIMSFDEKIASDIVTLFPEDVLPHLSIDEIAKITNDRDPKTGVGKNNQIILRGMRGTTALIVLVDKERENLWVANLGDCQAGTDPPSSTDTN
jgi:pyruvate dehydrogenase phosphatase